MSIEPPEQAPLTTRPSVPGVRLISFTHAVDERGSLVAAEVGRDLPFEVNRVFLVYEVPSTKSRGAHAHSECHQVLVAIGGSVNVIVSDGEFAEELILSSPTKGLYLPPMTWGTQHKFSASASLLVIASHPYDSDDYIRDFSFFLAERHSR